MKICDRSTIKYRKHFFQFFRLSHEFQFEKNIHYNTVNIGHLSQVKEWKECILNEI